MKVLECKKIISGVSKMQLQTFVYDITIVCETRPMTVIKREETESAQLFSASASLPGDVEDEDSGCRRS
jgi:hypothetical protein